MIILKIIGCVFAAVIGSFVLFLATVAVVNLRVDTDRFYDKIAPFPWFLLNFAVSAITLCCRVRLRVAGTEKVPDGRFLLVGNHCSNLDPIVTLVAFKKRRTAFISKPENMKIPFVGRLIRQCCFMPIDRENPRAAMTTVLHATKLLQNNTVSVGVYPEGTRSKTGKLLPFHNGVFKIAQKAKVPVVVVGIKNSDKVAARFPRLTDVTLSVLGVLDAETVAASRTEDTGEQVRALLEEYLNA